MARRPARAGNDRLKGPAGPQGTGAALHLDISSTDSASVLLTVADAAKLLKISETGMRRLQQRRAVPFMRVGGSVRFARTDLLAYLAKHRVESVDP